MTEDERGCERRGKARVVSTDHDVAGVFDLGAVCIAGWSQQKGARVPPNFIPAGIAS